MCPTKQKQILTTDSDLVRFILCRSRLAFSFSYYLYYLYNNKLHTFWVVVMIVDPTLLQLNFIIIVYATCVCVCVRLNKILR